MENTVNVQEVVKTAVELEKVRQQLSEEKANTLLYKELYSQEKKKSDTPKKVEIRYSQPKEIYDAWIGSYKTEVKTIDVITTDLNDALDRIKKDIETSKNATIEAKEDTIKSLQGKLKHVKEDWEEKLSDQDRDYSKYRRALELQMEDLRDELQKERDNKSDVEVEKKRKEELAALKVRIRELERQLNTWLSLNFFQRMWRKLTQYRAQVAAESEAAINKQEAEEVLDKHSDPWCW